MKRFSSPAVLLLSIVMLFVYSCNKESDKQEQKQEQKTITTKDTVQTKEENTAAGKDVTLSATEQKKLNVFFSNFSEAYLEPFTAGNITDEELIKFGVLHNFKNNYKLFEKSGDYLMIKSDAVSKSIEKYFGKTFTAHKPTKEYKYKGGYYFIPNADGEAFTFSQVASMSDAGGDKYIALINVYTASSGWTGDEHASPKTWGADGEEAPELTGKFKATFSKTKGENGEDVFKLIDYIKQ
jgi:hypothetical protein